MQGRKISAVVSTDRAVARIEVVDQWINAVVVRVVQTRREWAGLVVPLCSETDN
jgi:hypothetical protein